LAPPFPHPRPVEFLLGRLYSPDDRAPTRVVLALKCRPQIDAEVSRVEEVDGGRPGERAPLVGNLPRWGVAGERWGEREKKK
jgi:hypothetical protein